ncbi:hypothetical protein D5S18_20485 [Nocardia panacis]|uniref:Transposase (putative) YhgA-like domain-containing protein n=1 Tax=Nocardia panacis TaxID=2340916 RepID=A0A3A4JU55_9NOCA|nr:Rpn family recombination-promoting nuclease/putative transposase [Nocardia panacis]RJO73576.1 hypothetical protein D5S18_20485 [Nocardia panacis]
MERGLTHHDKFFRYVMEAPPHAASELRAVLPKKLVARVDWEDLSPEPDTYVNSELKARHSDLVYRTTLDGRDAYIYILIEHQTKTDPLMPFRMLEYIVRIWGRYLKRHPKSQTLPPVIPVVVHADQQGIRWNGPVDLHDLIDADPDTRAEIGEYLPQLRFILDDVSAMDVDALRARHLTPQAFALLTMLIGTKNNPKVRIHLKQVIGDLVEAPYGTITPADIEAMADYIYYAAGLDPKELANMFEPLGQDAREIAMSTAQRLKAEGEVSGRAILLINLLTFKFGTLPAAVSYLVHHADVADLDRWALRVLTAENLDAVFTP